MYFTKRAAANTSISEPCLFVALRRRLLRIHTVIMAFIKFSKLPRHQQYQYKPRFWNPEKEDLEERLKRVEELKAGEAEGIKARLSGSFRRGYQKAEDNRFRQRQVQRSNLVLLGVIALLLLFSYLFISVYLPEIAAAIGE